jgi:hypothetical protein
MQESVICHDIAFTTNQSTVEQCLKQSQPYRGVIEIVLPKIWLAPGNHW